MSKFFLLVIFFIVCLSAGIGALVSLSFIKVGDLTALEQYHAGTPSILLDDNGQEWARFELDRRSPIGYHQIPQSLINAFLAAEDRDFFNHSGISWRGILRSALVNIRHRKIAQGASTITQQLIKLMFLDSKRTYSRKIKEQLFSIMLERQYSKEHIFKTYVNYVYFGCGIYGIESAAQRFWGVSAAQLSIAQSASLASIVRSPRMYCPLINPEAHLSRRNLVLKLMYEQQFINEQEYHAAINEELNLVQEASHYGLYVKESIRQQLEDLLGKRNLYQGGLRIQTTIDSDIQRSSERYFQEHFDELSKQMGKDIQGAMVILDHATGEIKAMIGGTNFKKTPFNRALQSRRQMGSILKPLVYAQALIDGSSMLDLAIDQPVEIETGRSVWMPQNYHKRFEGSMTLARALTVSCNTIAAQLIQQVGPHKVAALARLAGISKAIHSYPSLALGCVDATTLEAASMFGVFAADGVRMRPYSIRWVKDQWGTTLYHHTAIPVTVMPRLVAQQVASVMQNALARYARLHNIETSLFAHGKTGTTNESRTCWFCGSTARYTTALYVGLDSNESLGHVYPSRVAFPLWLKCYYRLFSPKDEFIVDPMLEWQSVDAYTGQINRSSEHLRVLVPKQHQDF
jgi:penicillin-binding protein 1A